MISPPSPSRSFVAAAQADLQQRVRQHPFLRSCRNGSVPRSRLEVFLVQQGLYSRHFTRCLCATMSNLPEPEQLLALAENLFDELGFGDSGDVPHGVLYRRMLADFGLDPAGARTLPGTERLIDTLFAHCRDANPACGLGAMCLGAESLVPAIYGDVLRGFESHAVDPALTRFFSIHVECDDAHAHTMRDLIAALIEIDPAQADVVIASGQALVEARLAFFDGIQAAA